MKKKNLHKIIAFILALLIGVSQTGQAFAAIKFVSPQAEEYAYGEDILLSVKVTESKTNTIQISKIKAAKLGLIEKELKIDKEGLKDARGNPVTSIKYKVQGTVYEDANQELLTKEDISTLELYYAGAETDESYKTGEGLSLSAYKTEDIISTEGFTTNGELGYFVKLLSGLETGVYKIVVKEFDDNGKVKEESIKLITVKEETVKTATQGAENSQDIKIFEDPEEEETGIFKRIAKFFKSIFK